MLIDILQGLFFITKRGLEHDNSMEFRCDLSGT